MRRQFPSTCAIRRGHCRSRSILRKTSDTTPTTRGRQPPGLRVVIPPRAPRRIDRDLLEPAWKGVDDPLDRVFALLGAYRRALVATDLTYGCPIGGLALELRAPSETVRRKIAANFAAWRAAVLACLQEVEDRFPSDTDLDRLATAVLTVMEGGVMQARTFRRIELFDAGVALLRDHVDMLVHREVEG